MKTIGLLGGMSWESTQLYYRILNQLTKQHMGGLHSAKICLVSVDFAEFEQHMSSGNWSSIGARLSEEAKRVELAGAEGLLLCTNTMHKVADCITENISIPFFHIADSTAKKLKTDGVCKVGLLGTRFTMEQDFYKSRLSDHYGLEVILPSSGRIFELNRIIFEELCLGKVQETSRSFYLSTIDQMVAEGAEAIILGCTEIVMLIDHLHTQIPLYDTTFLHAEAAVAWALSTEE